MTNLHAKLKDVYLITKSNYMNDDKKLFEKIKIYENILNKIKIITHYIKKNNNDFICLENEKKNIIKDIDKLNNDLTNKNNSIISLLKKLNNQEDSKLESNNKKNIELTNKSLNLKKVINLLEKGYIIKQKDIKDKQNEIIELDRKIKLLSDSNISELKTKVDEIYKIDFSDELNIIITTIFHSLFEVLYGQDIANQIIK